MGAKNNSQRLQAKKKKKQTRHCVHTKENNDFQNDSSIMQLFFTAYNKYDFYL